MSKKTYIQKLAWVRKKVQDPFNPTKWVDIELFVPKPTTDNPLPCILVSIRNGHSKLFFRLSDVTGYVRAFSISRRMKDKLNAGLQEANIVADEIEHEMKMLFNIRKGKATVIDSDTGEILNEAERILADGLKD
jgi:hypothetical protein